MNDIIKHKEYYASLHFSADDEVFYGKILGINDLVTFEGESVKELKKSFITAIEDYIETCEELDKTPEKTYKGSFNVRVSPGLHREAAFAALQKKHNVKRFCEECHKLCYKAYGYIVSIPQQLLHHTVQPAHSHKVMFQFQGEGYGGIHARATHNGRVERIKAMFGYPGGKFTAYTAR